MFSEQQGLTHHAVTMHQLGMVFMLRAAHIISVRSMVFVHFNSRIAGSFRVGAWFIKVAPISGLHPFAMCTMWMFEDGIRRSFDEFMSAVGFHCTTTKGVQINTGEEFLNIIAGSMNLTTDNKDVFRLIIFHN